MGQIMTDQVADERRLSHLRLRRCTDSDSDHKVTCSEPFSDIIVLLPRPTAQVELW
jgi:hypothetical protein